MARTSRKQLCCGVLGFLCLLGGVVGLCLYRALLDGFVTQLMALREGGFVYERWKDPPYPIYEKYYFFDLLNKDEVLNGAKPAFLEKGPYTYREVRHKVNVTFNGNDTVSYVNLKSFTFVPGLSAGTENDTFTSINIAAMTLSDWMENERDLIKDLASLALLLAGETLFVTHTVGEMMSGYHEPLLTLAKKFAPALVTDDRFGIFMVFGGQYNSSDGVYTIYTGQSDPSKYTYIERWNGNREVNFWNRTGTCNMINGTVGTMYPIIHDKSTPIYVFQSDMCRSVHAVFESERSVRGIPVYRYTARSNLLQSGNNNPDNRCFCIGKCLPDGLMDGQSCHQGAPIVLSLPHFYQGDKMLLDAVWGLKPDKLKHQTFLDIEPTTGIAMNVARRVQVNMDARPVPHIRETEKIRKMYFPVLWLSETALVDTKYADLFKSWGLVAERGTFGALVALTCLGAVLLLAVAVVSYRKHTQDTHTIGTRENRHGEPANINDDDAPNERTSLLQPP